MSSVHFSHPPYFSSVISHSSALSLPHLGSAFIKLPSDCLSVLIVRLWHLISFCSPLTYPVPVIPLCRHGDLVCLSCQRFSVGETGMQLGAFLWQFTSYRKVSKRKEQSRTTRKVSETVMFLEFIKCTCEIQLQVLLQRGLILGNKSLYV